MPEATRSPATGRVAKRPRRSGRQSPPTHADLRSVARDLRWTWHAGAARLFSGLDPERFEGAGGDPSLLLDMLTPDDVAARLTAEPQLSALATRVVDDFAAYQRHDRATWFRQLHPQVADLEVAYLSAEYALSDALPVFAGGLGAVAGEQLKSASALGVPLVGVGLLYREASHQWLDSSDGQQESWTVLDPARLPVELARDPLGRPVEVAVPFPGRDVVARVWIARVGRNPLYLLDSAVPANSGEDRRITRRLYGGDLETRIQQELVLGVGGLRALAALGHDPTALHLNEGHTAFAALEHIRRLMARLGLSFSEAREAAAPAMLFTTHTPVAAGHDYFPPELAARYLAPCASQLGIEVESLLALGRTGTGSDEPFCPTILALRLCGARNGVSRLHGRVARQQWSTLWPRVPLREIPIRHVTNGIHYQSWLSPEMDALLERQLGAGWRTRAEQPEQWRQLLDVDDEELWAARGAARARLVAFARGWLCRQLARRGAPPEPLAAAERVLDPEALTVGFVGRFVAYKRPTLFLADPDRLRRLLENEERPLQILFAGKAHPRDAAGKELLREVVRFARRAGVEHRLVFLEDFDMTIDRLLVQGVDLWLNTPRRPLEACGIAGMKAGANGSLNLSTLDGWWDEAWHDADPDAPPIGWCIGGEQEYEDEEHQDAVDAESLYARLEREIVPAFYERDAAGIPTRWLASVKRSLATLAPMWHSHRMVEQYTEQFYVPGSERSARLQVGGGVRARDLAGAIERLLGAWDAVRVVDLDWTLAPERQLTASISVERGSLGPADIRVDAWIAPGGRDAEAFAARALPAGERDGIAVYRATVQLPAGEEIPTLAARILPRSSGLSDGAVPGLIRWSS